MPEKKFASIDDNPLQLALVEEYQCPGCVCGHQPSSGCFEAAEDGTLSCEAHVAGTLVSGVGTINLGLPHGFNRLGFQDQKKSKNTIRLYASKETMPVYNRFNVAVWAMVHQGNLLVRCYLPRVNQTYVDVIKDGTLDNLPEGVIDVGEFHDEIN